MNAIFNYPALSLFVVAATLVFLICRTEKSVTTKIMQILAVFIIPLALLIYMVMDESLSHGTRRGTETKRWLTMALLNPRISDARIAAAFVDGDIRQTWYNLLDLAGDPPEETEEKRADTPVRRPETQPLRRTADPAARELPPSR
ncbi:MAG: hypothetical protein IJJ28_01905 [Lentisphaeria bacterium]|nr:hypothetical protein [Lentisphaeria bacterium]